MAVVPSKCTKAWDASWLGVVGVVALILLTAALSTSSEAARGWQVEKPCDEIYVVGEGETLHTISDKCSDPYIVERNPHIHDPDDVFPGLVIRILPLAVPS
ncbi:hypothetical protein SASPL_119168 [Salvia splendens]|uniref:LysM domain-containing protein n=1 Tax=Salvia splendens TaxID=180675 RepID=A0A8X8XZ48_SALSN|nr:hypothetical protein SASPL_119168 [Salvia splendens]